MHPECCSSRHPDWSLTEKDGQRNVTYMATARSLCDLRVDGDQSGRKHRHRTLDHLETVVPALRLMDDRRESWLHAL